MKKSQKKKNNRKNASRKKASRKKAVRNKKHVSEIVKVVNFPVKEPFNDF